MGTYEFFEMLNLASYLMTRVYPMHVRKIRVRNVIILKCKKTK